MADQDFAHIESPTPDEVRPAGQMRVLMLTLLALVVVAGGFAVGFYVGQEMGMEKASSRSEARLLAELKKQKDELAKLRAEASKRLPEASTTQVGELTFYNELPKQSVEPEPLEPGAGTQSTTNRGTAPAGQTKSSQESSDKSLRQIIEQELGRKGSSTASATPAAASTVTSTMGGSYFLQLASFRKQGEAEKLMPKLDAAGFTGSVRRVELKGLGIWYRVYAGPYASKGEAEAAGREAKRKLNISGLVVKGG